MAVFIVDHRTIWNEADAITGWTGSPTLFTADPDPVEATGSIGYVVSTATVDSYYTGTSTDLTGKLVYVWVLPRGAMDTRTNGGIGIHLGDGTDRVSFHVAGSDISGFRHETGPVAWQCIVLDQSRLPSTTTTRAGSLATLTYTAITQIGATFKTLAKSVGGASNCFVDIIRIGDPTLNNGAMLTIAGGTSNDPGTFANIALADRTTSNAAAYGIVRELGTGLYGVQGNLRFGNATGTTSSVFADKNISVAFEDRFLGNTRYGITIVDNGTGTTDFKLGTKIGSGDTATGTDGCSIVIPSGVGGGFDAATDADVTNVFIYGSTLSGFTLGVKMRTSQELIGSKITNCGTYEPNGATITNSEISASTSNVACILNSTTEVNAVQNTKFTNNNRAIRLTAAGTYDFDNLQFTNNTYDVENASTGNVIINAINGTNVSTYINTNGGNVSIINAKTFVITNIIDGTEIRILKQSDSDELAGAENVGAAPTGLNGVTVATDPVNPGKYKVTYSYNYTSDISIYVVALHLNYQWLRAASVLGSTGGSLQIAQINDRQYQNL